ncbi:MAG: hypothetical protein IKB42_04395 [Clostridia bacterium]|nr:hypothetical protein [Clostridia bacterium]
MKRKFVLLSFIFVFLLGGCGSNRLYDMVLNNIAEVRVALWEGETQDMQVSFISGYREKDYVVNGYCTEPIEFGVLTFDIDEDIVLGDVVNYVISIGTVRYDGVLEHNPYNDTYVCDILRFVNSTDVIVAKIIAGEFVDSVELSSVNLDWSMDYREALRLAVNEMREEIGVMVENDIFLGECYIKILNDEDVDNSHYWYINFVSRKGQNYAVIIDPNSSEIMAKKTI